MSIRIRAPGSEFRKCDNCGYESGFHTSFLRDGEKHIVVLICPECGATYNVGWEIKLRK
jgi:predicted RNA-binding Zn-ribbon protein involved in translation (DUF1610 family)